MAKNKRPNLISRIFRPANKLIDGEVKPVVLKENTERPITSLVSNEKRLMSSTDVAASDDSKLIQLYRQMDNDAIISGVLDLYADNATQINEKTGHVIAVESSDKQFQEEINDFLWNTVNIDTEAWQIIRDIARDGYIFLDTAASNDGKEWSFTPVQDPSKIKALTYGQNIIKYFAVAPEEVKEDNPYMSNISIFSDKKDNTAGYTIEHKSRYIAGFNTNKIVGKMVVETKSEFGSTEEELSILTGRSMLAPVIQTWETLTAMEDALFASRLTKSRQFKIVKIDVSDSNNKQAEQIINAVKNAFRATETIDQTSDKYQSRQSPIPIDDFIYIPTKGEKGSVSVEEVGGDAGEVKMADIDYYRNKLFAGLAAPKAYLGYEETTPGGLGDGTVTKIDERLGRRITRLKNVLHAVVNNIIMHYWIHSSTKRSENNIPEYKIVSGKISTREEQDNRERLKDSIDIASNIIGLATNELFAGFISKEKLFKYVFNTIVGIDTKHIDTSTDKEDVTLKIKNLVESKNQEELDYPLIKSKRNKEHNVHEGKLRDLINENTLAEIKDMLENEFIEFETEDGEIKTLEEALETNGYRILLREYTYKQLKDMSKSSDPERLKKAKKSSAKYMGLDDNNNIVFVVTAEDPKKNKDSGKPTSYITKVKMNELDWVIEVNEQEGREINDRDIVRLALGGDLQVSCTCPAAKYWGQQYKGTKEKYSLVKNDIKPTRNIPLQTVCKHTLATLIALPFWNNSIVRDLRGNGTIKPKVKKGKKVDRMKDEQLLKDNNK